MDISAYKKMFNEKMNNYDFKRKNKKNYNKTW